MAMTYDDLRSLERSLAYEQAEGMISCHCTPRGFTGELQRWFDLDEVDEMVGDVNQEAEYLEARELLDHHPDNPRWVSVRDEAEPLSLAAQMEAL